MNINSSDSLNIQNQNALEQLAWAIEMGASEKNFSLIFAYCNSTQLRDRLIERLQEICSVPIQEIQLDSEVTQLFIAIQAQLNTSSKAVMVSGFEQVEYLDELLISANRVREEFRKKFQFPLVFWVSDRVQSQFLRLARDLESWATGSVLEFQVSTTEWIESIQQVTDTVFTELLEAGAGQYLPKFVHLSSEKITELQSAKAELEEQSVSLSAELEASLEFVIGCSKLRTSEEARQHYERSLQLWESVNSTQSSLKTLENMVRWGCVLFHLGVWWKKYAESHRSKKRRFFLESRNYLQRSLDCFDRVQRPDLVAKFINELGNVLFFLSDWDALDTLAEQAINLHKIYPDPIGLAHDYGVLKTEVAIAGSNWQKVIEYAEQAINILKTAESNLPKPLSERTEINLKWARSYHLGWYLFSLGRAKRQFRKISEAIAHLEAARQHNKPIYDPYLYLRILAELRDIFQEQKDYLNAFRIKKRQQLIEYQFRFRAFVGAGRISLEIPEVDSPLADEERQEIISQEIAASGREQNIRELIERISRSKSKLTVIYGSSGVGKSSLIQTGLIPALRQKPIQTRTVLPVLQRVYTNWIEQLGDRILKTFDIFQVNHRLRDDSPLLTRGNSDLTSSQLQLILKQLKQNYESNLLTVLIFDQFEEFFFECEQPSQRLVFYRFLQECLNIPSVKVILSLREDYLHYLLECNDRLIDLDVVNSDILSKDVLYYLGDFTKQQAQAVIERLTEQAEFSLEPKLIAALVEDLSKERGTILPIELQIVGAQLQTEKITIFEQYQQRGDKEKLVERYLEDVVIDCGEENRETVWKLLSLLTDEKGTRPMRTESEIKAALKLPSEIHALILKILVESGLIFKLQDIPENRYQLVHDYLVYPIRKKYDFDLEARLAKANLSLTEATTRLAKATQNINRRKKQLIFSVGLSVLMAALTMTSSILWQSSQRQQRELDLAKLSSDYTNLMNGNNQLEAFLKILEAGRKSSNVTANTEFEKKTFRQLQASVNVIQERNRLEGHIGSVLSVAVSPNNEWIASGGDDGTIIIWNKDGKLLSSSEDLLDGHNGKVWCVIFDPESQTIASAGEDKTIKLWSVQEGRLQFIRTIGTHDDEVQWVSFSPGGQQVASASKDKTVKLWSRDGQLIQTLEGHKNTVLSVSFSPDGQRIASASEDNTIKLWNRAGKLIKTLEDHTEAVWSVAFSPDSQKLVSASDDKTIKIWNREGELQTTLEGHQEGVNAVSFSANGEYIASASSDQTIKLWSRDGIIISTIEGHRDTVNQVSLFSTSKIQLASASKDGTIRIWSLPVFPTVYQPSDYRISRVSFSPNSPIVASPSRDLVTEKPAVMLWDSQRIARVKTFLSSAFRVVYRVSFSPDGRKIASISDDKTVRIWSIYGDDFKTLTHTNKVSVISFSPDGQFIATAGEKTLYLWTLEGKLLWSLDQKNSGHNDSINDISFSPDGEIIASAGSDGQVKLWSLQGSLVKTLTTDRLFSISFSRDNEFMAGASLKGKVYLWKKEGDSWRSDNITEKILSGHQSTVYQVSFSPDSQLLASASKDGTIKLWDRNGFLVTTLKQGLEPILSVDFSSDSKTLVSVHQANDSQPNRVSIWKLDFITTERINDLVELACQQLKGYLENNPNVKPEDQALCDL